MWLREASIDAGPSPALEGDTRCDVAIAGGGFVGLWTALRIKEVAPDTDVIVLEQDICGGGASGRNGGMALSWWTKVSSLVKICGEAEALRLCVASEQAIGQIESFTAAHGIDCELRRDGMLWCSTTAAQDGAWDSVVRACARLGVEPFKPVARAELTARTGSPVHRDSVSEPSAATLQPAKLARGLRRVALERGVRIYEGTTMTGFSRDRPVVVACAGGTVTADRLVLATNAWASSVRELHAAMITVSSDIVATARVPDRLAEIGWTGGDAITDAQTRVDYYRTTPDGRIAFGKGTAGMTYGHEIGSFFDFDARRAGTAAADFRRYYPMLADVPIEQAWGGPIDRTPDSLPILGRLGGRSHLLYGVGWSGNGVAPSVLGGRILASLALDGDDEWARAGLVDRRLGRFPPEPVRYVGGALVRRAVISKEVSERDGRRPRRLAVALSRLAPAGLEDKH
jgi:glycine/D-amino acid oxidase-like deaminating enzyme